MNFEKYLIYSIKVLLFACLFIPLIVTKSTFFPFVFGKAIVFQVLIEIAFILWIIWRIWFFKNLMPAAFKSRLLNYSLIFFFLILFFTTLTSLDSIRSFWSTQERMTGFFNWIHFGMFYIILISVFKKKDFVWLLRVSLAASILVSIITLGFYWTPGRLSGTLGNPGFLAMYLLFNIFFGVWLFFDSRSANNSWIWRIFYALTIILNLIVFYFARTRGAYLGLGIGLFLFIFINSIYFIIKRSSSWCDWKRWVVIGILIIFIIISFFAVLDQKSNFQRGSESREVSWSISWNAFKERPLLGWGPENYILAFAKHFDPRHAEYGQDWFDKAHNNVFEFLVTTGIFGLLAYLMILIFASIKSPKFVLPLLLAYFTANLFWMDTTVSLMLLFLVLAVAQKKIFA